MKVAIVGACWAGCAAAVALTRLGHHAIVFESSRAVGGRARGALVHEGQTLDNGQHILIGAYTETLALMESVGIDLSASLLAMPLALRFPDGGGLQLPRLRPPWDAAWGIALANGWSWPDKWSLLRAAIRWRLGGFRCPPEATVAALCRGISSRVMADLLEPLCVSALNTPAATASGQVFLRVLQDSLFALPTRLGAGSTLLLPRVDLSQLFPQSALQMAQQAGGALRLGQRVHTLEPLAQQPGTSRAPSPRWRVDGEDFGALVLACPASEAARLLAGLDGGPVRTWIAQAQALGYEAITTVYAQGPGARLPSPMLALRSSAEEPAQFAFDRGQLGGTKGLLALVASASQGDKAALEQHILRQARQQLGLPQLQVVQTIVEKRATFACTPGLLRPDMQIAPGLLACGDYVQGPYPATLEGAVRSGLAAARAISAGS